jgi:PII-like signaling protein
MGVAMQVPKDAVLLRIFIGENDKAGRMPLYEAIVLAAREQGIAGATVLRGPIGFGQSSHLHTTKILRLSQDLPIVIEMVDAKEKIDAFVPKLEEIMGSGLVTLEKVQVLRYGNGAG